MDTLKLRNKLTNGHDLSRLEDEIGRRGLIGDYIAALWDVIGAERGVNFWTQSNIEAFWNCIRATPEQRCRAALVALSNRDYRRE